MCASYVTVSGQVRRDGWCEVQWCQSGLGMACYRVGIEGQYDLMVSVSASRRVCSLQASPLFLLWLLTPPTPPTYPAPQVAAIPQLSEA